MKKKILFISEGTLISLPSTYSNLDHLNIDKLVLEPYVIPTLLTLQQSNFRLVMIIHQNSLDPTGFFQTDFNKFYFNIFTSQGIVFDDVLICDQQQTIEQCGNNQSKQWLIHDEIDKNNSYIISDQEKIFKLLDYMSISYLHYQRNILNWPTIGNKLTCIDRYAQVNRTTQETAINVEVWLDREGDNIINTGIGFFDHMLNQIATHGGLRMNINVQGDLHIDDHHTVEDTALALGEAIHTALGDKHGISRFGFVLPMDECLACCALDISGRPYLKYKVKYSSQLVGDLSIEMVEHFFRSLSYAMACTLHLRTNGKNNHHLVESLFKVFGRTLRQAIRVEGNILPSSKGII